MTPQRRWRGSIQRLAADLGRKLEAILVILVVRIGSI